MGHRFQKKLQKQIVLFTVVIIVCSIIIYGASLIYYANSSSKKKLSNAQQHLYSYVDTVYKAYADNLEKAGDNSNYIHYLHADEKKQESLRATIHQMNYSFQNKAPVKSNLMITDRNQQVVFHTFFDQRLSNQLLEFNKIINAKLHSRKEIQTGTISLTSGANLFMMTSAIFDSDQIVGYISYYLDGDDFSYRISAQQFDGVVYDAYHNVIAVSDKSFINSSLNRCIPEHLKPAFTMDNVRYLAQTASYQKQGIYMTAYIRAEDRGSLLFLGTSLIVLSGGLLIIASIYYSRKLSRRMSRSVSLLCDEIETIKQGNLDHKIELHTDDEFETISENINEMVEQIQVLTQRNAELNYVSRLSELKQLEAQFNPHFLYNTLETIRYSILMQDGIASDMIIKFTKILRYSINNTIETVPLQKDLEYIHTFLQLQKYRFRDHLSYSVAVDEECMQAVVPKLILQPLLENSIKNGFKHKTTLNIQIRGYRDEDAIVLQVVDDGIGLQPQELHKLNEQLHECHNETDHHGLFNTHRRLYLMYGEGSGITMESTYKEKTIVTIRLVVGGEHVQDTDHRG